MSDALLDTHVWFWLLTGNDRLPARTFQFMQEAETLSLCPISIYEVALKARTGKWDGMTREKLHGLMHESRKNGIELRAQDGETMMVAGFLDWTHRDPWDRLIAATALKQEAILVSADTAFDAVPGLERFWE